jgi:hypothetical protein
MECFDAYACFAEADEIICLRSPAMLHTAIRYGTDTLREASITPAGELVD